MFRSSEIQCHCVFQIIRDNSGPGLKPSELLPSRLADNQLHRYSRVLQSNLGNVFRYISISCLIIPFDSFSLLLILIGFSAQPLPACPALKPLVHSPLNSSQPVSLAGAQKLLSVGGDIEFPVIPGHFGDWSDGIEVSH